MCVSVGKSISSLQISFNFTLKDSKCKIFLSLLLFILVYNKLAIVVNESTLLLLLCNAFVTKHYVTKFTTEWWSE